MIELKRIGDVPIYVLEDGRFQATIGKQTMTRKELREIEKRVNEAHGGGVKVIVASYSHPQSDIIIRTVVRRERDNWRYQDGSLSSRYGGGGHYVHTPELEAALLAFAPRIEELSELRRQLETDWQAVLREADYITQDNFAQHIARQGDPEE